MDSLFEKAGVRLLIHVIVFGALLAIIIPLSKEMTSVGIKDADMVGLLTVIACVGMFFVALAMDIFSVYYQENFFAKMFYWLFFVIGMLALCFATFVLAVCFLSFFSYGQSGAALRAVGPWKLSAYVMGQSFGIWYIFFLIKAYEDDRPNLYTLGTFLTVLISYFSYVILIALAQKYALFAFVLVIIPFVLAIMMIVFCVKFLRSCFWTAIS